MQPGPERAALYAKLAQYVAEQVPLMLGVHRTSYVLKHAWLKNYKFSTFSHGNSRYYDVDLQKKKEVLTTFMFLLKKLNLSKEMSRTCLFLIFALNMNQIHLIVSGNIV